MAIAVLGMVGGSSVIEPLAKELENENSRIRRAAIETLGRIADPKVVPTLIAYFPKADEAEKGMVLTALSHHFHPDVVKLMLSLLADVETYSALRLKSALGLGNLRAREAVRLLVGIMLNTAEPTGLRLTCVSALGKFSKDEDYAIAGLIGALADERLAEAASMALSRITRRYLGADKARWEKWFREERDAERKQPAVRH